MHVLLPDNRIYKLQALRTDKTMKVFIVHSGSWYLTSPPPVTTGHLMWRTKWAKVETARKTHQGSEPLELFLRHTWWCMLQAPSGMKGMTFECYR